MPSKPEVIALIKDELRIQPTSTKAYAKSPDGSVWELVVNDLGVITAVKIDL